MNQNEKALAALINGIRTMTAGKMSKGEFVNEEWVHKGDLLKAISALESQPVAETVSGEAGRFIPEDQFQELCQHLRTTEGFEDDFHRLHTALQLPAPQPVAGQVIGEAAYVLTAELYDPNMCWPSDDDEFDDDKLVIWENLTTGVRWPEVCHFTQWTPKSFAKGIKPLDAPNFKKVVLWGPVPDLKNLRAAQQPQAPAVEVPGDDRNELAVSFAHESIEALLDRFKTDPVVCAELTVIKEALLTSKGGR